VQDGVSDYVLKVSGPHILPLSGDTDCYSLSLWFSMRSFGCGQWRTAVAYISSRESFMTTKKLILSGALGAVTFVGGFAIAQLPVDNISSHKHPNLAAAQRLSQQAFERVTAAQQANEFDMDGHAAKAKELLDQVNEQLRMAATDANHNHR
jgi:hypothetical protein